MLVKLVPHSYGNDCVFLLKDLTDEIKEVSLAEKEALIASGVSYAEMISKEIPPSSEMMSLYESLLEDKASLLAGFIGRLAAQIKFTKGEDLVLVSLARAGTPFGVLLKRYFKQFYQLEVPHYSVSIIRGKGIDEAALQHVLQQHPQAKIQFIDGWTGKGSIIDELERSITCFNQKNGTSLDARLAVLADPAKRCEFYGTRLDFNIPNCCLNATISGLISRTLCRESLQKPGEFHGAKYLKALAPMDVSMSFVEKVSRAFEWVSEFEDSLEPDPLYATQLAQQIALKYEVADVHKVKLSIGESMRVLLRRQPKCLILKDETSFEVQPLLLLAKERGIEVKLHEIGDYVAAAIIDA